MGEATTTATVRAETKQGSPLEVLLVATRLGITSFGGPIAHIGYFRNEYVTKRGWVDEATFADLVALSQFLPGAASSKLGMSIGIIRAGSIGGLAAWLGFTLPSAAALVAFAAIVGNASASAGWIHGFSLVAVAVVALAVWNMGRTLTPDRPRQTIAIVAAVVALSWASTFAQVAAILLGASIGWFLFRDLPVTQLELPKIGISRKLASLSVIVLIALLLSLPFLRAATQSQGVAMFDGFYRSGALVFGGGHVVLPLLQAEVVPRGWVTESQFLAGYGATQAVPGPLFTFAAYLGAVSAPEPNGVPGAAITVVAIFLPSMLIVYGTLPFWEALRKRSHIQAALRGVNAAVVGILAAALYQPVWTTAVTKPVDLAIVMVSFGLLALWRVPVFLVVIFTVIAGALVA